MTTDAPKSSAALILLAWIFVGIPLSWGVYNTVRNSMKLFQRPAPAPHASTQSGEVTPQRLSA